MPTKILAIDDSKTMRLAIKITFAAEDAEVVAVSRGSEAVARAKQMGADVVLVDHRLADGEPSGYDVCRALRADPATENIPVLLLISTHEGPDQSKLAQSGAAGTIGKPFDTQELIDKVAALASGKGTRPRAAARPVSGSHATLGSVTSRAPSGPSPAAAASPRPAAPIAAARPAAPRVPAPASSAAARSASSTGSPLRTSGHAATPAPSTTPVTPSPAPGRTAPPAARADIPVATPIPFAPASAPTPGMLKRLQDVAGGAGAEIDAQTAAALLAMSREVIEQVVWEVVPDLAEQIIREMQQARSA